MSSTKSVLFYIEKYSVLWYNGGRKSAASINIAKANEE
jgi:hypothetical protein